MAWLILLRVLLSVSANAVQKRLLLNHAGIYPTWILTYGLMLGPASVLALWRPGKMDGVFWRDIAIGGGLDALGNLAMIAALRVTDVSVFGPLNALRPILALLFGWLFLAETPTTLGMAGVAVTVAGGVILLSDREERTERPFSELASALFFRVAGLSLGVVGAVFLKRAALHSSAEVTVTAWIGCGLVVLMGAAATHRPRDLAELAATARTHSNWLALHAGTFLLMQWFTILIFQGTLLAYSFVYFQLGMVLQVFVGRFFFQEAAFARRLIAALIMAAGSVLVLWKG
jgi:uncharacterized membrane protein